MFIHTCRFEEPINSFLTYLYNSIFNIIFFVQASNSHKGPYDFEKVEHVQEFKDEHEGAIWCMKFSGCGRLLATAGQDKVLRIWIVRYAFPFFQV